MIEIFGSEGQNSNHEYKNEDMKKFMIDKSFIVDYSPLKVKVDGVEYRGCVLKCGYSKDAPEMLITSPFSMTEIEILNDLLNPNERI